MQEIIGKFNSIVKSPYTRLAEVKRETGKKIVGCLPMYVPEEIMHAAGMLPVVLLGSSDGIFQADLHNHPYLCHSTHSNFDLALRGNFDFLDLVIFSDFCFTVNTISEVWQFNNPSACYHHLFVPKNLGRTNAMKNLSEQFFRLRASIEKLSCQTIDDDALRQSISVYDHNRKLFHRLYQLRRVNPKLLTARDMATVVAASMLMPKEEHNQLLSELLVQAETIPHTSNDQPRLVVTGYLCDMPELDVLDLIEEAGAVVSDDDLYVGRRYCNTLTEESINPMEALVQRYLNDVPCPTKYDSKRDWSDYILNLVEDAQAEAVVIVSTKWCHVQNIKLPGLSNRLSTQGIPNLVMETDYTGATGQMRTRLEAFIEMLRG